MIFAEHIQSLARIAFFSAQNAILPIHSVAIPQNYELIELLTGGEVVFDWEGEKRKFSRGTIFWHLADERTIWDTTRQAPYRCAVFSFAVSKRQRLVPRVSFWQDGSQALDDFVLTSRRWYCSAQGNGEQVQCLGAYCCATLLRQSAVHSMHESGTPQAGSNAPASQNDHWTQILRYIERNLEKPLSVETLCAIGEISRTRLFRTFQSRLQQTPHAYLLERRIQYARKLLEESNRPLKEIAECCGFEHIEVFYRSFLRITAMTPGEYRKRHTPYLFFPEAAPQDSK